MAHIQWIHPSECAFMLCLEDHPRIGSVVNNHGDRFRPLNGVVGPLIKWPFHGL